MNEEKWDGNGMEGRKMDEAWPPTVSLLVLMDICKVHSEMLKNERKFVKNKVDPVVAKDKRFWLLDQDS